MRKELEVYYQIDDESTPEEVEARLTRAFKFLFGEYEMYLKRKRMKNGKRKSQLTS